MTQDPKIVLHAGTGKTGTTTIQRALAAHRETLAEQGIVYLGHMFEHAGALPHEAWQESGNTHLFTADPAAASEAIHRILMAEWERARATGVRLLIWSNETLFGNAPRVLPALDRLRAAGIDVEVQCYVRRHDAWAVSAYQQWGIKHKHFEGPVLSFADWLKRRPVKYERPLRAWSRGAGDRFRVFNYDAHPNVLAHFCATNGLPELEAVRANETRDTETLFVWAAYNSQFEEQVLPQRFEQLLRIARSPGAVEPMIPGPDFFPTAGQLAELRAEVAKDARFVSEMLVRNGEAPLDFGTDPKVMPPVDKDAVIRLLMRMLFTLDREARPEHIHALEREIERRDREIARLRKSPLRALAHRVRDAVRTATGRGHAPATAAVGAAAATTTPARNDIQRQRK